MKKNVVGYSVAGIAAIALAAVVVQGCGSKNNNSHVAEKENKYKDYVLAKPAPEWSSILKNDSGWLASDGIYCVALDGSEAHGAGDSVETFMWFSDTILGTIENDTLNKNFDMVHQSVAYFKGLPPDKSKMKFYWGQGKDGKHTSFFTPKTPSAKPDDYYWLGDGVFNHAMDSTIYIIGYRVEPMKHDVWPFKVVGVSLIILPKGSRPPFANYRQIETPLMQEDKKFGGNIMFGSCMLPNTVGAKAPNPDGYIYLYGQRGPQNGLIVSRVKDNEFEDMSKWRFWNGTDWGTDIQQCAVLIEHAASELSLSFMSDGRLFMAYQMDTTKPDVMVQLAKTPVGPFYPAKKVYHTPELYEDIDIYTYSAKGFPHLSKPGELLIAYNVNAFNFENVIKKHPRDIHPRFITVKYE